MAIEVHASDIYPTSDIDMVVERAVIDPPIRPFIDSVKWRRAFLAESRGFMVYCVGLTAV